MVTHPGVAGLSRNSSTGPIASGRTFVNSAYKQNLTFRPSMCHPSTSDSEYSTPPETSAVRIASGSGSRKKPPALQSSVGLATPRHAVEESVVIEPRPCLSPRGEISEGPLGESSNARTPDRVSVESFSADSTEEGMFLDRSPDNGVSDLDELDLDLVED
ncbi:unnamed protein product [Didymodactylos carnosus]|uniref:Uncharacterized protein n=1 Tax=Didymodactylos carnosus TaxID=1234261 RepID=A0A814I4M4_9BILA|nr:unnamed protein product [Didymodactylos carnosus]CAF3790999.1 unnamed protein product [Didymodactylos carnosus]